MRSFLFILFGLLLAIILGMFVYVKIYLPPPAVTDPATDPSSTAQ